MAPLLPLQLLAAVNRVAMSKTRSRSGRISTASAAREGIAERTWLVVRNLWAAVHSNGCLFSTAEDSCAVVEQATLKATGSGVPSFAETNRSNSSVTD